MQMKLSNKKKDILILLLDTESTWQSWPLRSRFAYKWEYLLQSAELDLALRRIKGWIRHSLCIPEQKQALT